MMKPYKNYELDETNRRRMNMILGKALSVSCVMYTEDEKRTVNEKTLQSIVNRAKQIQDLVKEIASEIGVEISEG